MNDTSDNITIVVGLTEIKIPKKDISFDKHNILYLLQLEKLNIFEVCKHLNINKDNLFRYSHILCDYLKLDIKEYINPLTPQQDHLLDNLKIFELSEFYTFADFLTFKDLKYIITLKTKNILGTLTEHEREYAINRLKDNESLSKILYEFDN